MTRYLPQTVLGLLFGAIFAVSCFHIGACTAAHAQPAAIADAGVPTGSATPAAAPAAAPVLDPLGNPGGAASTLKSLYQSGAWLCLAIVLAFFILYAITKETHWLATGKRKAYAAAFLGGLALLVVPASQGTTPNLQMIVAAVGTALALLIVPDAQKTAAAPASS